MYITARWHNEQTSFSLKSVLIPIGTSIIVGQCFVSYLLYVSEVVKTRNKKKSRTPINDNSFTDTNTRTNREQIIHKPKNEKAFISFCSTIHYGAFAEVNAKLRVRLMLFGSFYLQSKQRTVYSSKAEWNRHEKWITANLRFSAELLKSSR